MANLPTPIEIDLDKPRKLYVTLGSMYEFEKNTGKSMENMEESMNDILQFLASTMKLDDPDVQIEDFMHYVHPGNMEEIVEKIEKSMKEVASTQEQAKSMKQAANGKGKNAKRPTG